MKIFYQISHFFKREIIDYYTNSKNKEYSIIESAKGLLIEKEDLITFKHLTSSNVEITIKKPLKIDQHSSQDTFAISFDDSETMEYFFEKFKNHYNKLIINNPSKRVGVKLETARFKAIKINRELDKIKNKI